MQDIELAGVRVGEIVLRMATTVPSTAPSAVAAASTASAATRSSNSALRSIATSKEGGGPAQNGHPISASTSSPLPPYADSAFLPSNG